LAGVPVPAWNQGLDWSPHLRGEEFGLPTEVLIEMQGTPRWNPRFQDWRGLVTEHWKYAIYEDRRETLYDLENDPYELTNLAADQPDRSAELRRRLLAKLKETRDPYFDVIIEHGVAAETPRYHCDMPAKVRGARVLGGLDP
jgi:arylsulfatase A-like enzyme